MNLTDKATLEVDPDNREEINVKRLKVPGYKVTVPCPHCGNEVTMDFSDLDHFNYPTQGGVEKRHVYCENCEKEGGYVNLKFEIKISLVPDEQELSGSRPTRQVNQIMNAKFEPLPAVVTKKVVETWLAGIRVALGEEPTIQDRNEAVKALSYAGFLLRKKPSLARLVDAELELQASLSAVD